MKTFAFSNNNFARKTLSVFLCVALLLGLMPTLSFLAKEVSAAPVYDSSLGTYTEENGVLTATAYKNCGFRGWFDKEGNEVSVETSFTIPSEKTSADYIPVFYSYNLLENGDFEAYSVDVDLKTNALSDDETWYFYEPDGNTWPSFKTSKDYNHTENGSVSLRASVIYNTGYRYFRNLKPDTQYTLKFWYYCPDENGVYLDYASVSAGLVKVSDAYGRKNREGVLGHYSNTTVYNDWQEVSITFYTGRNTEATLAFRYSPVDEDYTNSFMYIDDLSLISDEMAAPSTYANDDFSDDTPENWGRIGTVSRNVESGKLKVAAEANVAGVHSRAMCLKKGYKYTFTATVDLSNTDDTNWFCWSLTNAAATIGSLEAGSLLLPDDSATTKLGIKYKTIGSDVTLTTSNAIIKTDGAGSKWRVQLYDKVNALKINTYDLSACTLTVEFTAPETTVAYFNIWANYDYDDYMLIDNFAVTETAPTDSTAAIANMVADNALECVGTAIRTSGKQGLRYKTGIDKRLLSVDKDGNPYFGIRVTEYGTVAIKTSYLNGQELVLNKTYTDSNGDTMTSRFGRAYRFDSASIKSNDDARFDENAHQISYTGVLINIAEKYENSGYTMRPYVKYTDSNGNVHTIYGDALDTTVFEVSKLAYSAKNPDGTFAEEQSTREYLYNNILKRFSDKTVTINNASTPVSTTFQGINSTVYHCYTFMEDSMGRYYTDEAAAKEMDRLVDSGVTNVRTIFKSQFAWNGAATSTTDGWNWNSADMQAVYKWAKMLQDRGITITINAGWHIYDFIAYYNYNVLKNNNLSYNENSGNRGHSTIPEVDYLHGAGTALYGEDSKAAALKADMSGLALTDSELSHYSVAAVRYGEWIARAMQAFKQNGINNVDYIMPFTESGDYQGSLVNGKYTETDATFSYDEWIIMTAGLNNALKDAGIRNNVKIIGPNQSLYAKFGRSKTMLDYYLDFAAANTKYDMVDILSSHQYTYAYTSDGGKGSIYNTTEPYNNTLENFNYYIQQAGNSDKEFWCDEFFAYGADATWADGIGMQLTQVAAGFTAAANTGIDRLLSWQIFDTLWTDATNTGGEFIGGVHACGTSPSMISGNNLYGYEQYASDAPRVTYYGLNLLGKYLSNRNAIVYSTVVTNGVDTTNGGVYVTTIKGNDGKIAILAVNTTQSGKNVTYNFEDVADTKFVRYTYNPAGITPTGAATSLPSDGTISCNNGSFYDSIAPGSFAIYVQELDIVDNDVNMDAGLLD